MPRTCAVRWPTVIASRRRLMSSSRALGGSFLMTRFTPSANGTLRAFEAGPDGLDIIAIGGPKPEGGDGVRATATWPEEQ
jgi:hypothetical protein